MKPEDAKKRWCPMARIADNDGLSGAVAFPYNRYNHDNGVTTTEMISFSLCIADDCMCWKWEDHNYSEGRCGLVR